MAQTYADWLKGLTVGNYGSGAKPNPVPANMNGSRYGQNYGTSGAGANPAYNTPESKRPQAAPTQPPVTNIQTPRPAQAGPQYQTPQPAITPQQQYGAVTNIAGGINDAFSGGSSRSQQEPWTAAPNYRSPVAPTLQDYGNSYASGIGFNMLGDQRRAAQDVAGGINNAFDQQQYYQDKQSDRQLKMSIAEKLMSGMGGMGGAGNRMQGFVDVNSGQAASLPGQSTNAITAQALSPQAIAGAAGAARGATSAPANRATATPGQASEVNQIAAAAARNRGGKNANTIDRSLTADNANLKRSIELAKSRQGLGNAEWMTGMNQDNAQYDVAMRAPLIRALMAGLA